MFTGFAVLSACEDDIGDVNDIDIATDLPWPTEIESLPDCSPYEDGFNLPHVSAPSGAIFLDLSAALQPVGVIERIEIEVRTAASDDCDTDAQGAIAIDVGQGAQVLEVTPVVNGKAEAQVRFDVPGEYRLTAVFVDSADSRTGEVGVKAYDTQLSVWEMGIDQEDLDLILDHPFEKIRVPAILTVDSIGYETKVRLHGGTSRDFLKKSFRFDFMPDLMLPDTHDHLILRAEWNDKTMLRTYLGYQVFRNATWIPTPKTEMVHFRVNNRYYGLMNRAERIGGDFLRTRGLNRNGNMYEADPSSDCWDPGGNLTPVSSLETYQCIYDLKKGEIFYDDLISLIEDTLQLSDEAFIDEIEYVVDVNEYLTYMATMAIIQNQDHIKKNYYIYHDPESVEDLWVVFPWDLDLSFGHLWTAENDVLDEAIITNGSLDFGICPGFCNKLMDRIYRIAGYRERYHDLIDHILEHTFTPEFIDGRIDNAICLATPEILVDPRMRASLDEYMDRVQEIRDFVDTRREFIFSQ